MVLQRVFHLVRSRAGHVHPLRNRILLVPKSIPVVLHKHVTDPLLLMRDLLLLFGFLGWLADDVCDYLLQILIVKLGLVFILFDAVLWRPWLSGEEVSPWAGNGIDCLLHLRVHTLPGLILEDTRRLRLSVVFGMRSVLMRREVKIIRQGMISRMGRLPIMSERVSFVEGVPSVILGLVEERRFIILVLLVMMQHILLLLRNKEPIFYLTRRVGSGSRFLIGSSGGGCGGRLLLVEVIERFDEFLG
jgi:hypothetical protein